MPNFGNFLIWLSGARRDILDRCVADRPKYVGIGSAVLITACMAAVSMTVALHTALKVSLDLAIPLAIAWGIAILSLDRWLVVSLVRQQNKWGYLLLALPRVALAVLFGLIISTPFTLLIFQPEINQAITKIQTQRASDFYNGLKHNGLYLRIQADQAQVSQDEKIIAAGGATGTGQGGTVGSLAQQLQQAQQQKTADYNRWQCQLYGPCKPTGNGPLARADQQSYDKDVTQVNQMQAQLDALEKTGASSSLANARKDLGPAKSTLAKDSSELSKQEASFNNTNENTAGLLLRLQALSVAEQGSGGLATARWALFLFFTAIECLPVMVKVLLNLGPPSTYEKALSRAEGVGLRLAEQETMRQYLADILDGEVLNEENERVNAQWREKVMPRTVEDTVAARERVTRERLRAWERDANSGSNGDSAVPGGFSGTSRNPETDWTGTSRPGRQRRRPRRPRRPRSR